MTDPEELAHWLDMRRKEEPKWTPEFEAFREALQREFEETAE